MGKEHEILRYYPSRSVAAPGPTHLPVALPHQNETPLISANVRRLPDQSLLAVSASGDHVYLTDQELLQLRTDPNSIPLARQAELQARFVIARDGERLGGTTRLLESRRAARSETIETGPALHIIVPTLQCAHSCRYCQVSRSLEDTGHTMSIQDLNAACDTIFQSPAKALTVEFQGGDPLLRFDLVRHAIQRISEINRREKRAIRYVVASTLHQLTEEMCVFFRSTETYLSTSLDGPAWLHNKNRPIPSRDSYERTVAGIDLARRLIGPNAVSALMTTTKESLEYPEAIVDEYVRLGFHDIFLRPLSSYGFAKRNHSVLSYSVEEFEQFYQRGLQQVLRWNRQGVLIREVYASIVLNKILSTFDGGYVDLQSPTGAGSSVLVYNYDGHIYPSDEARMLAESGDGSLRLGRIGRPLKDLLESPVRSDLIKASTVSEIQGCDKCTYNQFCAPNPVDAHAQHGSMFAPVHSTEHCRRHMWLFDTFFLKLRHADDGLLDIFYRWAAPWAVRKSDA
jgi:His-Xaa-Ser system radical SAM maturase HxsB